ncbi:MAG: hypothetical protein GTO55_04950, partial [Armatimonadetes bacterium]|nr:hypothetical protein [Armatimonadota bacterium]NIM23615.1 hypothetical protein [Armatimonadota bacterium]NIM67481.1 hypothetical protein [Armatimonadota bacterium]NIM75978.1 hypothetical protein [Armatimonadota bacterium]NIN05667.1 hypothetical protein [Armatimonadota bacterium]
SLIIGAAVISFLASPALMSLGTVIYGRMRSWTAGDAVLAEEEFSRGRIRPPSMQGHVILCGYGRVGSHIGEMLLEE